MAYSCSDFTSSLVNHLYDNGLIKADIARSDDLEHQATASMAVISDLAARAKNQQSQPLAARFMDEMLDAHETLTEIGEEKGARTLADCMYMLSAVQKGTFIEVHHPSESEILDVVQALPSATVWMDYVREVAA
jgi:hypothetical protein